MCGNIQRFLYVVKPVSSFLILHESHLSFCATMPSSRGHSCFFYLYTRAKMSSSRLFNGPSLADTVEQQKHPQRQSARLEFFLQESMNDYMTAVETCGVGQRTGAERAFPQSVRPVVETGQTRNNTTRWPRAFVSCPDQVEQFRREPGGVAVVFGSPSSPVRFAEKTPPGHF